MQASSTKKRNWKQKLLHEMVEYYLSALYMTIFFSVFSNYRRLILAHYEISYEEWGISVIKAMILAKVILVAESLRLGRGFEKSPLIFPTIYKSLLFTVCAAIFSAGESLIRSFIRGIDWTGAVEELMRGYNYEWLAGALVLFFAFIPFFAFRELRVVLGPGKITKLFFRTRAAIEPGAESKERTGGGNA